MNIDFETVKMYYNEYKDWVVVGLAVLVVLSVLF